MASIKSIPGISFLCLLICYGIVVRAQNPAITPGTKAPFIKLKNIDDKVVSFDNYPASKGFVIIFVSNTCPYSKAYEQRIIDLDKKYAPLGFPVIAINSNDPGVSPGDSFDKMKQQAKSKHYTFAYLCDDGQVVADLYGARSTPQVFVISKSDSSYTVEYSGAIDNDAQNKNPAKINYTANAVEALLNHAKPAISVTRFIGCSISRKKK